MIYLSRISYRDRCFFFLENQPHDLKWLQQRHFTSYQSLLDCIVGHAGCLRSQISCPLASWQFHCLGHRQAQIILPTDFACLILSLFVFCWILKLVTMYNLILIFKTNILTTNAFKVVAHCVDKKKPLPAKLIAPENFMKTWTFFLSNRFLLFFFFCFMSFCFDFFLVRSMFFLLLS